MSDIVGGLLIVAGGVFIALAGAGQVRFSDLFTRMHIATKPSTLGILLVATGTMFRVHNTGALTLLLLTVVLQFVTGPVSAHLVGRAAHRHGDWEKGRVAVDQLAEEDEL